MNRRTYCGLVGITALSGCSALSTDGSTDDVGEEYEIEERLELTVDRVETQSQGRVWLSNETPITGGNGISFVLTYLIATNTTEEVQPVPAASNFQLLANGIRQDPYQSAYADIVDNIEGTITDPVSGPLFPPTAEIGPDETAGGWLVFTVPNLDSTANLELRINDEVVANWMLAFESQ